MFSTFKPKEDERKHGLRHFSLCACQHLRIYCENEMVLCWPAHLLLASVFLEAKYVEKRAPRGYNKSLVMANPVYIFNWFSGFSVGNRYQLLLLTIAQNCSLQDFKIKAQHPKSIDRFVKFDLFWCWCFFSYFSCTKVLITVVPDKKASGESSSGDQVHLHFQAIQSHVVETYSSGSFYVIGNWACERCTQLFCWWVLLSLVRNESGKQFCDMIVFPEEYNVHLWRQISLGWSGQVSGKWTRLDWFSPDWTFVGDTFFFSLQRISLLWNDRPDNAAIFSFLMSSQASWIAFLFPRGDSVSSFHTSYDKNKRQKKRQVSGLHGITVEYEDKRDMMQCCFL